MTIPIKLLFGLTQKCEVEIQQKTKNYATCGSYDKCTEEHIRNYNKCGKFWGCN
jgi:hypothetical protein